jgi:protein-S-isoprenylcysteine O-methyltransferase Ste14
MNNENVFTALFCVLFASMTLVRVSFSFLVWRMGERIRAERGALRREGLWTLAIGRLFWLLLGVLIVYVLFGGSFQRFALPRPDWLRWAGFVFGMTCVGLFTWIHIVLGRFWSPYLQLRPSHRIISTGPYARIRHPMYSAIIGWLISLGLVASNWTPLVFAALAALFFMMRIPGEEKMMLQQFGDQYREYMKRTGRLLPIW